MKNKIKKDRNQPGLHRSELNSRIILIVEQTNPIGYCTFKGNNKSTSRSQTFFSIRTLKKNYAVIPIVTDSINQKILDHS